MGANPVAAVLHRLTPQEASALPELFATHLGVRLFAQNDSGWCWEYGAAEVSTRWADERDEPIAALRSNSRTMLPVNVAITRHALLLEGSWVPWSALTDDPFSGRTPYRAFACAVAHAVRGDEALYVSDWDETDGVTSEFYAARSFEDSKHWLRTNFGPPRDAARDDESIGANEWWHDDFADFDAIEADLETRLQARVTFAEYGVDPLRIEPHPEARGGYLWQPTRHWVQRPEGDPRGWRTDEPRGDHDVAPPMPVPGPPPSVSPEMLAAFDALAATLKRRVVVGWHLHKMTIEAGYDYKLPAVCMDGTVLEYVGCRDGEYERAGSIDSECVVRRVRLFDAPSLQHRDAIEKYVSFARPQRIEPAVWIRSADGVRPLDPER